MHVLVSGSRSLKDTTELHSTLKETLPRCPNVTVIVGGASGVDQAALEYCLSNQVDVDVIPADWETHGKRAGILRNLKMLDMDIDEVLVIWDGQSPGAKHTLTESLRRKKDTTLTIIGK